jgi:hypothetical protein
MVEFALQKAPQGCEVLVQLVAHLTSDDLARQLEIKRQEYDGSERSLLKGEMLRRGLLVRNRVRLALKSRRVAVQGALQLRLPVADVQRLVADFDARDASFYLDHFREAEPSVWAAAVAPPASGSADSKLCALM